MSVGDNRTVFLDALRSGQYPKGPFIKGGDAPDGAVGYCAIGLPYTILLNNEGPIIKGLEEKLGLSKDQIYRIQNDWNDSPLTFPEIADKIESEMFALTS